MCEDRSDVGAVFVRCGQDERDSSGEGTSVSTPRPPRLRLLPPGAVDQVVDGAPGTSRAELVHRLELALAALPPAERMAVVAAHGFDGGAVGAAMELEVENDEADALVRSGLQLLRAALAGLDDD